jgi:hypothetical protein
MGNRAEPSAAASDQGAAPNTYKYSPTSKAVQGRRARSGPAVLQWHTWSPGEPARIGRPKELAEGDATVGRALIETGGGSAAGRREGAESQA